jgi:hypothetical protein
MKDNTIHSMADYIPLTVSFLKVLAPTPTGSSTTGFLVALPKYPTENQVHRARHIVVLNLTSFQHAFLRL